MEHFTYGPVTPVLGFLMSCVGACLALLCVPRARATSGTGRLRWLLLAAFSLGGTGIWTMHFIAMLGFSVPGEKVRYDIALTLLSMLVGVTAVGVGLAIVIQRGSAWRPLLTGGTVTGLGVASMHYLGMAAMQTATPITYNPGIVALSVFVAVFAATAALWATLNVRRRLASIGAVPVMGLAVTGMHYIGMASMGTSGHRTHLVEHGARAAQFLAPLIIGISMVTLISLFIVALWPNVEEMAADRDFDRRINKISARETFS
jgi:NO-binding membrane sensor protein with MHYT domain